jgi:hypothetical protein
MDAKKFGSAMSTIAHSQAVMAAVRDYKKVTENFFTYSYALLNS